MLFFSLSLSLFFSPSLLFFLSFSLHIYIYIYSYEQFSGARPVKPARDEMCQRKREREIYIYTSITGHRPWEVYMLNASSTPRVRNVLSCGQLHQFLLIRRFFRFLFFQLVCSDFYFPFLFSSRLVFSEFYFQACISPPCIFRFCYIPLYIFRSLFPYLYFPICICRCVVSDVYCLV